MAFDFSEPLGFLNKQTESDDDLEKYANHPEIYRVILKKYLADQNKILDNHTELCFVVYRQFELLMEVCNKYFLLDLQQYSDITGDCAMVYSNNNEIKDKKLC